MNEPITEDEIIQNWTGSLGTPHYVLYLAQILNGEVSVEVAREDLLSFRRQPTPKPNKEDTSV